MKENKKMFKTLYGLKLKVGMVLDSNTRSFVWKCIDLAYYMGKHDQREKRKGGEK